MHLPVHTAARKLLWALPYVCVAGGWIAQASAKHCAASAQFVACNVAAANLSGAAVLYMLLYNVLTIHNSIVFAQYLLCQIPGIY